MGSTLLKLIVLSICLNTFLYLGVNYAIAPESPTNTAPTLQDDLFDVLLRNKTQFTDTMDTYVRNLNSTENYTSGSAFDLSGNFSTPPTEKTGSSILLEQGGFAFLDVTRMVLAFVVTMWKIATISLTLFSYNLFPPVVSVIIGLPLIIINITAIIIFLRGGGGS